MDRLVEIEKNGIIDVLDITNTQRSKGNGPQASVLCQKKRKEKNGPNFEIDDLEEPSTHGTGVDGGATSHLRTALAWTEEPRKEGTGSYREHDLYPPQIHCYKHATVEIDDLEEPSTHGTGVDGGATRDRRPRGAIYARHWRGRRSHVRKRSHLRTALAWTEEPRKEGTGSYREHDLYPPQIHCYKHAIIERDNLEEPSTHGTGVDGGAT
ncbi:hypothetical protein J6590_082116 [Homalodisca vitripennis]|nr:hypothetical protein J6590_082116 [Homalodisca vitripennis]